MKKKLKKNENIEKLLTLQRCSANLNIVLTKYLENVNYCPVDSFHEDLRLKEFQYYKDLFDNLLPMCSTINNILLLYNPPEH